MGSPTAPAGSYNFTVQVTDSTGNIATQLLTLFINGLIAPQISPTTIPGATSGQPYSQALSASGGSGTGYIWSLGSGFLPIGFAFTSSGVLSSTGIPAAPAGSYAFTVQVTDSAGNIGSQLYTLVVQRPRGTITLLDPVPTLLASSSGSPIISTSTAMASLAPSARVVQGVASDGVTQVVIDISNALPNENLSLTVSGDGGLAALGSSAFQPSSLTFPADAQGNAFALYQAPVDFDDGVDSVRASRNVSLHLASIDDPTFTADSQITIVRPLVMLIPGLWSKNHQTWNRFTPLVNNSMFEVVEGDYDTGGFVVSASDPYYPPWLLNANLRGSALSLSYSTPIVLQQLQIWLQSFRNGANPVGLPVAAIQADIVGHSMGGLVARNMVLQPGYLSPKNYGTGLIHKLITIDTPHLGTPLAGDLLDDANECVSSLLALGGDIALNKVSTQFGQIGGAVADLEGDGGGNALSPAIQALGNSNGTPIPVAMIAAETNVANLSSISFGGATILIATDCLFPNDPSISDPLAISLNPGSWNNVFKSSGDPTGNNDGVVGLYSQLDGLSPDPNLLFNGYIHDFGLEGLTSLGFSGPSVIDAGAVPSQVIDLLNTSKLDTTHYYQLAP
jgi:pimeloyl-ACP methyl ester carboxylesterase